jgi:hemolysin activation/secretion protein
MKEKPPLPPALWARILAFIQAGQTGTITLNVHQGRVGDVLIAERIKARNGE